MPQHRKWVERLLCSLGALASGAALGLAFAPYGLWPVAFLGIAGLTVIVAKARSLVGGALYGYLFGLGFGALGLNWMSIIFIEAMFALIAATSFFYLAAGLLIKLSMRLSAWPLIAAGVWVGVEFVMCRWPFGGFGWMRLGYAMVDSPLAGGYPLIGVVGVGFLVALIGQVIAWICLDFQPMRLISAVACGLIVFILALGGIMIQPTPASGTMPVGWVQGGLAPGGGVYGLGVERTITKHEVAGTEALMQDVASNALEEPAFIVWPENGTDKDPYEDPETSALLRQAIAVAGRPILSGHITLGPGDDERQTVSIWWSADGVEQARYVKREIVPFGEFVPGREFMLKLVPKLAYVGRQSVPGDQIGLLDVQLDSGPLKIGVLMCYDVAFDQVVYDTAPGELLVVQSSNAMYQGTGQIEQQFAITRARAAELRREILVVTTSGVSGVIDARGNVTEKIVDSGEHHGVADLPLRTSNTPALWLAPFLDWALTILTALSLITCIVIAIDSRRKR
ncbi:MAG: apolipoprotein N-acyltransferase [Propionibacteriaceae bacterium]|nr:apolipoprotein N-acyltransferase [Propionibacteriaceae bacterium]